MRPAIRDNPLIWEDMKGVEETLTRASSDSPEPISRAITELVLAGGKRLRPALVLISGHFGAYDRELMIRAASALEIVHLAALVHDDIIDGASVRRGRLTLNERFGPDVSVFAGDFLFTQAFALILDSLPRELITRFSQTVRELCIGEMLQFSSRYDPDIPRERYMRIIQGKTASLFILACDLGTGIGRAPLPMREALRTYALHLGTAFQIVDDVLDILGDTKATGKGAMNDLRQGVYTLPVICALNHPILGGRLRSLLGNENPDEEEVLDLIRRARGTDEALKAAARETNRAVSALGALPDTPYRELLYELASSTLERNG